MWKGVQDERLLQGPHDHPAWHQGPAPVPSLWQDVQGPRVLLQAQGHMPEEAGLGEGGGPLQPC